MAALLILIEFVGLALLGYLLVQLMHWETQLNHRRAGWLAAMRDAVRRLRTLRRQLDKTGGEWPEIPMGHSLRRKWVVARWAFKAVSAVKWARS